MEVSDGRRLRSANWRTSLGDRVRLLVMLEEHGPLTLEECLRRISPLLRPTGKAGALREPRLTPASCTYEKRKPRERTSPRSRQAGCSGQ